MKYYFLFVLTIIFLFGGQACSLNNKNQSVILYIGTFTNEGAEGLYKCVFNTTTGEINNIELVEKMESPNYLTISKNRQFLYACVRPTNKEIKVGAVRSYKIISENGDLEFLNEQLTSGSDPCYIDITPDGKLIAVANYGGSNLTIFHTNEDGSLNELIQSIEHQGSGPNIQRQTKPHAHSIRFSPFDDKIFAADLGIDKLMYYQLEKSKGILKENTQPFIELAPGAGPRHFEFHPSGNIIYVVNELNSTVTVLKKTGGEFKIIQENNTLPSDYEGENYCADIHISSDASFLYCSNRGHNSIATFKVNKDGLIEFIGTTPTQGDWPRNFTFSPDYKFLLVANQKSNNISVYKVDPDTGIPVITNINAEVPTPVCLVFL